MSNPLKNLIGGGAGFNDVPQPSKIQSKIESEASETELRSISARLGARLSHAFGLVLRLQMVGDRIIGPSPVGCHASKERQPMSDLDVLRENVELSDFLIRELEEQVARFERI